MKTTGIAMWAYTRTPDTRYEPCWKITLILSKEEAKRLKDVGLKVPRNDDDEFEFKFKRYVARKKGGGENTAPRVVDAEKNPFEGIIGNGSIVNVQFAPFNWEHKGKKGKSADLQAIQVVKLVEYVSKPVEEKDEFDSVESEEDSSSTSSDDDDF